MGLHVGGVDGHASGNDTGDQGLQNADPQLAPGPTVETIADGSVLTIIHAAALNTCGMLLITRRSPTRHTLG